MEVSTSILLLNAYKCCVIKSFLRLYDYPRGKFHGIFHDFDFGDADDGHDIFRDASQVMNDSVRSGY